MGESDRAEVEKANMEAPAPDVFRLKELEKIHVRVGSVCAVLPL